MLKSQEMNKYFSTKYCIQKKYDLTNKKYQNLVMIYVKNMKYIYTMMFEWNVCQNHFKQYDNGKS